MNASNEYQIAEDFLSCFDKLVEFTQVECESGIETIDLISVLKVKINYD